MGLAKTPAARASDVESLTFIRHETRYMFMLISPPAARWNRAPEYGAISLRWLSGVYYGVCYGSFCPKRGMLVNDKCAEATCVLHLHRIVEIFRARHSAKGRRKIM